MFSLPILSLSADSGSLCTPSVLLWAWDALAEPIFGLLGLFGLFVLPGDFFLSLEGFGEWMGLPPTGTGMTPLGDLVRCLPGDETLGFLPGVPWDL